MENGNNEDHRMRLTYYNWRALENGQKPHPIIFEGDGHLWHPTYTIKKVNAHSKYVWFDRSFKDVFTMRIHELREGQSHFEEVSISMMPLYKPYGLNSMDAAIHDIWEFVPDVLLLNCKTSRKVKTARQSEKPVDTFLWDTVQGKIRETRRFLPYGNQKFQIDLIGTPTLSMFRAFSFR
jgi:hypothetical protein